MASVFIPNPDNLKEVNHIDGNKLNNSVSNLEWISRIENHHHASRSGLRSDYKPFMVEWNDGTRQCFEFAKDLSSILNLTKASVLQWLRQDSFSFLKYGIKKIYHI